MDSVVRPRHGMLTRREMMRVGSLLPLGLSLPSLLANQATAGTKKTRPQARACLIVFMEGGPSQIDMWDMKPNAPANIRGEFQPIATQIPGLSLCEHLPQLARHWHRFAQIRTVTHTVTDHNAGSYYALTGRYPVDQRRLIVSESTSNFPPYGAVLSRFRPPENELPPFIHIPEIMSNNRFDIPGERAGFLGGAYDPFVTGDPSLPGYKTPDLTFETGFTDDRYRTRGQLLQELDRTLGQLRNDPVMDRMNQFQQKAITMITSPHVRDAFDLSKEPESIRERYGVDRGSDRTVEARKFGGLPHLGQCCLLARRLLEAGVPLITLVTGRRIDQSWDTHREHFPLLKQLSLIHI